MIKLPIVNLYDKIFVLEIVISNNKSTLCNDYIASNFLNENNIKFKKKSIILNTFSFFIENTSHTKEELANIINLIKISISNTVTTIYEVAIFEILFKLDNDLQFISVVTQKLEFNKIQVFAVQKNMYKRQVCFVVNKYDISKTEKIIRSVLF